MKVFGKGLKICFLIAALAITLSLSALGADDSGISVQIGDKLLSFSDVTPTNQNGRVFVPFRAVFEALGAEVSYTSETETVTAVRGETTVTFTIGQKGMEITKDSISKFVETDAASYIESSRTMIPVRFAAEAFGCNVGWDSYERTVLILDTDTILSANDAQYTLMDKYIEFSQKYDKSAYAINGSFDLSMNESADGTAVPVVANGTITGLSDSSAVNLDMNFVMDLDDLAASYGEVLDEETKLVLSMLKNLKVEYIFNLSDNMLYLRSPLFSLSMGTDSKTWFSMDLGEMLGGFNNLRYASDTNFKDYVKLYLGLSPMTDTSTLTENTRILNMLNSSFCDKAFVKNGDTYMSAASYQDDETDSYVTASLVFIMKDNNIDSLNMSLISGSEMMTQEIVYALDSDGNQSIQMKISYPGDMEMKLKCNMKYTETEQVPVSKPEEGSTVVPME